MYKQSQDQNPTLQSPPTDATNAPAPRRHVWWPRILIALNFLVVLPAIIILGAIVNNSDKHPEDWTGLAFLFIFWPVFLAAFVILILDIIGLGAYLFAVIKHKEPGHLTKKTAATIAFLLLLYLVGGTLLNNFFEGRRLNSTYKPPTDAQVLSLIDSCGISSLTKVGNTVDLYYSNNYNPDDTKVATPDSSEVSAKSWSNFVTEVKLARVHCIGTITVNDATALPKYSWASVQDATALLQQCGVNVFSYGSYGSPGTPSTGVSTGIILESGLPFSNLYIDPGQEGTMAPIARAAQPKCGGPQFRHDGKYEIRQTNGTWK